ncbi:MAG: hypothetical protein ACYDCL_16430 [Myxococcales bacterium]
MRAVELADAPGTFWDERRATAAGLAQLVAWTVLALLRLPRYGHFLDDEAQMFDRASEVAHRLVPAADGPFPVSGTHAALPGGAAFDLLAPPFLVSGNPHAGVVWVILLSSAGVALLDRALRALGATPRLRLLGVTLSTWSFAHARFADRMWNPHLFLFATPLLFWLSARLRASEAATLAGLAVFGFAASLLPQIHLLGLVPVALCVVVAWPALRRAGARLWAGAAGFCLGYLPYAIAEAGRGFANSRLLAGGRPAGLWLGRACGRSLLAFATFPSQADSPRPERFATFALGAWQENLGALSFWTALALLPLGLCVRGPWRRACVIGAALVPLALAASGRDYYPHYVVGPYPFYFLPAAAALSLLAGKGRAASAVVLAYAVGFCALGGVRLWGDYGPGAQWTIDRQIDVTRHLVDVGGKVRPAPRTLLAEQPDIYRILARRLQGREVAFAAEGVPCDLSTRRHPDWESWPEGEQILSCAPPDPKPVAGRAP